MMASREEEKAEVLIIHEAVRLFYGNIINLSWLQILFPLSITILFYGIVDNTTLFGWLALILSTYLGRVGLVKYYLNISPVPDQAPMWAWYMTSTSLCTGFLWGFAAFSFHDPQNIYNNLLIYLIIIGFSAGSIVLSAYWFPVFYAFAIPAYAGIYIDQLFFVQPRTYTISALLILFILVLHKLSVRNNKMAYAAIHLGSKNNELIKKLQLEKQKAEVANHAKTRFLASANHDLRQPVHALSLLVHGLKKELDSTQGKLLSLRLERSVDNLGNLLDSLLDLSRLDASAVRVNLTTFSVASISAQLLTEFLPIAREKSLRFSVRPCDKFLHTDKTLLLRLLRNLLNNAFRYTNNGGVQLGYRLRDQELLFEIWDSGIGIAEPEKDKIFGEFYQSENRERDRAKGLGLGLSICQRIAFLLNTEVNFSSREGKGSVFRFRLPIAEISDKASASVNTQTIPTNSFDISGKTLLIIDDDREVLQAMIPLLKSWQINPITARNSLEAFEILDDRHLVPDAIISDHRLSDEETGLEAIKKLHQRAKIPALIITGDTAPENLLALEQSGFPVLHKPASPERLYKTLCSLL